MARMQAKSGILEPDFAHSLFVNRPEKVSGAGLNEARPPAWLYFRLEEPVGIARDVPVNELAVRVPTGEWSNIVEKLPRIER